MNFKTRLYFHFINIPGFIFILLVWATYATSHHGPFGFESQFSESIDDDLFSIKMFTEVQKQNPGRSIVLSAYSVLTPLTDLIMATNGSTRKEILNIAGTGQFITSILNYELQKVNSKSLVLYQGTQLFVPNTTKLNKSFQKINHALGPSIITRVNSFEPREAADQANFWAASVTKNKIKHLVHSSMFRKSSSAVLANAIYFKGNWKYKFDKSRTQQLDFYSSGGNITLLPTMHTTASFEYAESYELDSQLLKIPFGSEGDASMLIVLPNFKDGLLVLTENLRDPDVLKRAKTKLKPTISSLFLPKFKIVTETNLVKVLKNMNVTKVFGDDADFSPLLSSGGLKIGTARQKAVIEVNEDGVDEATVNVINEILRSQDFRRANFIADHPFYFEIEVKGLQIISGTYNGI